MAEHSGSPVFAGRYRYEPVEDGGENHDGFAQLVYDLKTEKMGIIKRADLTSEWTVGRLKNEMEALQALQGLGVPEVYDTGEAEYDSMNYFYIVLEYVERIQVEKNLDSLTASERVEILTQFFRLLAEAHQRGILNGDIDLTHLYWNRDKKQLFVIDWANARLNVDPNQKTEFADDLARSAGIIFSLVTRDGYPIPMKSFALPDESGLYPELPKLPIEFRNICMWAPRTAPEGAPYHTASELFEASKRWDGTVYGKKPYEAPSPVPKRTSLVSPIVLVTSIIMLFLIFTFLAGRNMLGSIFAIANLASTEITQPVGRATAIANAIFLPTPVPTELSTQPAIPTSTPADVLVPAVSPSPGTYTEPILIFDQSSASDKCWANQTNLSTNLWVSEGFTRRRDGYWRFGIERGRTTEEFIQSDFKPCLGTQKVTAIALNAWVVQLEIERESPTNPALTEPGKEFGFFIEDGDGGKREYTIWVDKDEAMHVRIRENSTITYDEIVSVVNNENLKLKAVYPRLYAEFPIQIFFEVNNNGLDILYLQEAPFQLPAEAKDMNPSQMERMDSATQPTFRAVSRLGLIGYGGETQTVIWPLVFFGN